MTEIGKGKTPWHLWVVGIVTLLWNAIGANDYLQTQLGNLDYFRSMSDTMNAAPQEALAYFQSYPAWADGLWAVGVWGGVLGSLLLLLRSRWAVLVFGLSLAGVAGFTLYQAVIGKPEWATGTFVTIMGLVVWSIATFLLIYAISMRRQGVLR